MHALNLLIVPESEQCWLCGEEAQRDIQQHVEEKKRLTTLEQRVSELEAVVAAGKRLA